MYNLGQKIVDKFRKLNEIGFSMEQFMADFSKFFSINNALPQLEQLLVPSLGLCCNSVAHNINFKRLKSIFRDENVFSQAILERGL